MESPRHKGFVIGSDPAPGGQTVWKVRVKDPGTPYNSQKLVVVSVRGGLELARGLNVHFAIGTMDGPSGTKVLRAVDVCLEAPDGTIEPNVARSGGQA